MNATRLEDFMNNLTDQDWGWWPAVRLRPAKDRDMDNVVLFRMTLVFGVVLGFVYLLICRVVFGSLTPRGIGLCLIGGCLVFFFLYKFTFAIYWNRRARRLRDETKI